MKARLAKEAARANAKYGQDVGSLGSDYHQSKVVPTGSLALDYALGTGGWKLRHPVMIFGAPDIGKSSILGLAAIRNAQQMGLSTAIIAVEPGFDADWATKHGVDPDLVIIYRPDSGEEAFAILHELVRGDLIDFILFDSIGAILRGTEGGVDGKPNVGGSSPLITWGIKNTLMPCWKNEKGLIMINQQREDMKSHIPGQFVPPGGQAVQHGSDQIVYLRHGRERYTIRMDDGTGKASDVIVGREIVAQVKRNKLSEGTNMKAVFDYYQMESDLHPVGIDVGKDMINTAIRSGVIVKAGSYLRHSSFPKANSGEFQLQGRDTVAEYLATHPSSAEQIRAEVLAKMAKEPEKVERKLANG